jgi:hypothetical protein
VNLEIDVSNGCVSVDDKVVWQAGALNPPSPEGLPVRCLDLPARLVIDARAGAASTAFVLFDEEDFPETILGSSIVKRFARKTGVMPEQIANARAIAGFPWGEIEFFVEPKQGDLSIEVRGR